MKITIHGSGYVGLVTGACLADVGHDVMCVDVDQVKVARLKRGEVPIYEPGLEDLIRHNMEDERLTFSDSPEEGVAHGLLQFIAVGTPPDEDGSADLTHVLGVARTIGQHMDGYRVIINKSTVPVGTADKVHQAVADTLEGRQAEVDFDVCSNPEFLKEGAAVRDFMAPDRIVIGSENPKAGERLAKLYAPLVRTGAPILQMDIASAEMTKYAANAMLATRISFMNEIANLCSRVNADVSQVRRGMGTDPRIGKHFLFPGVGYGGSCFPKDVRALIRSGEELDLSMSIIEAVEEANERQKRIVVEQVLNDFGTDLTGRRIAVWGLAFKAQTDDMREAPSIVIIEALLAAGASITAFDPQAMHEAKHVFGDRIHYGTTAYSVLDDTCALLVITDWNEFRAPDFEKVRSLMSENPIIYDGRNLYETHILKQLGFAHRSIGRQGTP